jgi:hypothetical protein
MVELEFFIYNFDKSFTCLLEYNFPNKLAIKFLLINVIFFIFEWLVWDL